MDSPGKSGPQDMDRAMVQGWEQGRKGKCHGVSTSLDCPDLVLPAASVREITRPSAAYPILSIDSSCNFFVSHRDFGWGWSLSGDDRRNSISTINLSSAMGKSPCDWLLCPRRPTSGAVSQSELLRKSSLHSQPLPAVTGSHSRRRRGSRKNAAA